MTSLAEYSRKYAFVRLTRDEQGILEVSLPDPFTGTAHRELPNLWYDIAHDLDNRIIILTGSGDNFIGDIDFTTFADLTTSAGWDTIFREGTELLRNLAAISMPIIAAVNGPAKVHGDFALLADITIASEDATFRDNPHISVNLPPGDGAQVVWPYVLGPKRASYFLLTDQTLTAQQALEWGAVNEVLPKAQVLPRARALAQQMSKLPTLTLRYTRYMMTQRIKRLLDEGAPLGLALEGLNSLERSTNTGA